MSEIDLIQVTVRDLCTAIDRRDWNAVRRYADKEVMLDLSSYTAIPPSSYEIEVIIDFWKEAAKSVIRTHHTLQNFVISKTKTKAKVICDTGIYQALNKSASNIQSFHGKYKFELELHEKSWKVNSVTFLFDRERSNDEQNKKNLREVMKEFLQNEPILE